jgi:hypothetical protein
LSKRNFSGTPAVNHGALFLKKSRRRMALGEPKPAGRKALSDLPPEAGRGVLVKEAAALSIKAKQKDKARTVAFLTLE